MTLDVTQQAGAIVAAIAPYLNAAGLEAAKVAGKEVATKLLGWLRQTLAAKPADKQAVRTQEALADLERAPDDGFCKDILKAQLAKLLAEDAAFAAEAAQMLVDARKAYVGGDQVITGNNVKASYIAPGATGNSVTIS